MQLLLTDIQKTRTPMQLDPDRSMPSGRGFRDGSAASSSEQVPGRVEIAPGISAYKVVSWLHDELYSVLLLLSLDKQKRSFIDGHGLCVGLSQSHTGIFIKHPGGKITKILELLRTILDFIPIVDFNYTSLQINRDSVSEFHTDKNNLGPSVIVGVGDFSRGELICTDTNGGRHEIDMIGRMVTFDCTLEHGSLPFKGTTFTLVLFSHNSVHAVPQKELDFLTSLGFRPPPILDPPSEVPISSLDTSQSEGDDVAAIRKDWSTINFTCKEPLAELNLLSLG